MHWVFSFCKKLLSDYIFAEWFSMVLPQLTRLSPNSLAWAVKQACRNGCQLSSIASLPFWSSVQLVLSRIKSLTLPQAFCFMLYDLFILQVHLLSSPCLLFVLWQTLTQTGWTRSNATSSVKIHFLLLSLHGLLPFENMLPLWNLTYDCYFL